MSPLQILADIIFFAVFIQLFIALSLYLSTTIYSYIKANKAKKPAQEHEPEKK